MQTHASTGLVIPTPHLLKLRKQHSKTERDYMNEEIVIDNDVGGATPSEPNNDSNATLEQIMNASKEEFDRLSFMVDALIESCDQRNTIDAFLLELHIKDQTIERMEAEEHERMGTEFEVQEEEIF